MSLTRTETIIARIEQEFKRAGKAAPERHIIVDALDEIQKECAIKENAIKYDGEVIMEKGQPVYDLGLKIHQLKGFIPPRTWHRAIKYGLKIVTSTSDWEHALRIDYIWAHPLYAMVWNERLRLHPAPQTTGEVLKCFMFLMPAKQLVSSDDPEISLKWDMTLKYGALSILAGGDWETKYLVERADAANRQTKEISDGVHSKHDSISDLGF